MISRCFVRSVICILVILASSAIAKIAQASELKLAVTSSFENSGLAEVLVPQIEKDLDIDIQMLVVGTGQALKLGRAGDVDAVLVHSKTAELQFIAEGYGTHRREIMYNDFVIVGPSDDPAGLTAAETAADAFAQIAEARAPFVSRGDDSGTHRKEVAIWNATTHSVHDLAPSWYRETGSGMGAALNTASGLGAYILTDRASWLKFKNKGDLKLVFSGDPDLFNQYALIAINPQRHPHVANAPVLELEAWLTSKTAQELIGSYEIDGEKLFVPNAKSKTE